MAQEGVPWTSAMIRLGSQWHKVCKMGWYCQLLVVVLEIDGDENFHAAIRYIANQ